MSIIDPPGYQTPKDLYLEEYFRNRYMDPYVPYMPSSGVGIAQAMMATQMPGSMTNNSKFTETNMNNMLATRMGWNVAAPNCKFKKVSSHKLSEEKAVVFVIHGERALTIEDDLHLYPSDALVTQLRLLEDGK